MREEKLCFDLSGRYVSKKSPRGARVSCVLLVHQAPLRQQRETSPSFSTTLCNCSFYSYSYCRILQNQNQTLQEQVRTLSNRVAELEDTLAAAQGQGPSSRALLPHRDLHHERDDDSMQDFEDNMQRAPAGLPANGVGSLRIGEQGQAKFHGLTAASEVSNRDRLTHGTITDNLIIVSS